ncbi:MAG TPA: co-chaperone DjlA [Gammaproteobacteria bacterium]|nr:co-chaperone DjlA [Gammaproteobacteria bacterium]
MSEAVIGAFLGLAVAGWRGLVIGALLGYAVGWIRRTTAASGFADVQAQFIESTFAVMGALCKADSVVTRDEIRAAEQLFERLHLSAVQREAAKTAFARGKAADFDLDAEVARFRRAAAGRGVLLQLFLQAQILAVGADGALHPAEHAMLVRVARGLGLPPIVVVQLEALLRASSGARGAGAPAGPPPRDKLADAYAALGLAPTASDAEIKRAYRRLMSQNHPDKLAAKGLPESMRELAEERTREISAAYRLIKETRPGL